MNKTIVEHYNTSKVEVDNFTKCAVHQVAQEKWENVSLQVKYDRK